MSKYIKIDTPPEKIFFTSDTHFSHKNIINYCSRPFSSVSEMNEKFIENWNNVVSEDSLVFHLGDFAFSSNWQQFTERLNGKICLILGNHDIRNWKNHFESLFAGGVFREFDLVIDNQKMVLSHYPLFCWSGCNKNTWNLHGHIHSSESNNSNDPDIVRYRQFSLPTQYDCGVDNNNFTPISFPLLKEKMLNM